MTKSIDDMAEEYSDLEGRYDDLKERYDVLLAAIAEQRHRMVPIVDAARELVALANSAPRTPVFQNLIDLVTRYEEQR